MYVCFHLHGIGGAANEEMGTVSQGMWVIVEKADKSYFEIKNPVMNSLP